MSWKTFKNGTSYMYQTVGSFLWRFASELQDPDFGCIAGIFELMYFLQDHSQPDVLPSKHIAFQEAVSIRSTSCLKLVQPFAHSNAFKSSFIPLLCSLWNNLPLHIVQAPTPPQFKKLLLDYLHSVHV